MKALKLTAIVAAGLLAAPSNSYPQEPSSQVQAPTAASIVSAESSSLIPGQAFIFQIRFDRAPEGYNEGRVEYEFANVAPVRLFSPGGFRHEQDSVLLRIPVQDGEAIYNLTVPITESMARGIWTLKRVSIGESQMLPVQIPSNVTFQIPGPPPVAISIDAPKTSVAGHPYILQVHVENTPDKVPEFCLLQLTGTIRLSRYLGGPTGPSGPQVTSITIGPTDLEQGRRSYEVPIKIAPDIAGGEWQGELTLQADIDMRALPPPRERFIGADRQITERIMSTRCYIPVLEGQTKFSFTLEPADGLVTPNSATVTVNPSQAELLLGEADKLRAQADQLKRQLSSSEGTANQGLLYNALKLALVEVDTTQEAFNARGGAPPSSAANGFFDSIRFDYGEVLKRLPSNSVAIPKITPRIERVGAHLSVGAPLLSQVSKDALASISHAARAYEIVASTGSLTFNLDVYSDPKGATISYRQRGKEYYFVGHETDWRIENLDRGVYTIRLQKEGYEDAEYPFDAMDDTRTSISVTLKRKRGAR